ncbi:MAG: acyl-CoA dehydrogenase [Chitinophagales bacterium]|nr:MAG: acyl-CoA dehydrogenase [Chitinophagales bacterium]
MKTHEVFNQPPALEHFNLYDTDRLLTSLIAAHGAQWAESTLKEYGSKLGSPEWIEKGFLANTYTPVFHSHDRFGNRIDYIEYHPAYHELMAAGIYYHLHALPWVEERKGAHMARLALNYLHAQNEAGTCCPITMTFSCIPPLSKYFPKKEEWIPRILSRHYDAGNKPYTEKAGITIGMAMTEKQGGTDVRANTTRAVPLSRRGPGEAYSLTGHKWFCSAPMCDAFLTLAYTDNGLSCFLLPRWLPDGTKNSWYIQRLKNKLGNRSNASSEIEMEQATAWLIGEEGRGVPTIIEMVAMTRYDCMIGSSGLMKRGVTEAVHHCSYRKVQGKQLIHHPLMQNVLADLCIEAEAALALTCRAARCLENASSEQEQLLLRLLLPVGKYWITKRAGPLLAEAMECIGGNGYVEQSILPRLYREAPVNAIWEGSGNVQCLDVLRAISKNAEALDVFLSELEQARGKHPMYDEYLQYLKINLTMFQNEPGQARRFTESLATAMQAAQLLQYGNQAVAEAFCVSRLGNRNGHLHGNLPNGVACMEIIQRHQPLAL